MVYEIKKKTVEKYIGKVILGLLKIFYRDISICLEEGWDSNAVRSGLRTSNIFFTYNNRRFFVSVSLTLFHRLDVKIYVLFNTILVIDVYSISILLQTLHTHSDYMNKVSKTFNSSKRVFRFYFTNAPFLLCPYDAETTDYMIIKMVHKYLWRCEKKLFENTYNAGYMYA